jgi:hypothetical protein
MIEPASRVKECRGSLGTVPESVKRNTLARGYGSSLVNPGLRQLH